jgi:hypothetical protein
VSGVAAKTVRVLVVGNSFSNNATRFLPQIVEEGGHELVLAKAQAGGCSLERHWKAVEAWRANPADPAGKIYSGKSLEQHAAGKSWDVVTIQQNSMNSTDPATYRPYAGKLHAHLRQLAPGATIWVHQTWAYRTDAAKFGQTGPGQHAASQREMWERSRAAYAELAREFRLPVLPVGDAFWRVDSDPQWGFRPDPTFDEKILVHPAVPPQRHSLHVGYRWNAEKKLGKDANHANAAGEYLGALVWYGLLFDENPARVRFVPPGVDATFAAQLRKVAAETVTAARVENRARTGR